MRRPIAALLCCLRAMPACAKCPQPPFAGLGELRQAYDCMAGLHPNRGLPPSAAHIGTGPTRQSGLAVCGQPAHSSNGPVTNWAPFSARSPGGSWKDWRDARANNSDIRLLASHSATLLPPSTAEVGSRSVCIPIGPRAHGHRSAKVCDRLVRLGTRFDGSKVACNSSGDVLPQTNCRVVSVGSNGDPAFESAVHKAAPWCVIETWDGTLVGARAKLAQRIPAFVNFVPRNWDATTIAEAAAAQRVASMLKIDCEGCEAALVPLWVDRVCTGKFTWRFTCCRRDSRRSLQC